jgi:hypothetical protein
MQNNETLNIELTHGECLYCCSIEYDSSNLYKHEFVGQCINIKSGQDKVRIYKKACKFFELNKE